MSTDKDELFLELLVNEERALQRIDEKFQMVQAEFFIAARKYAAARDTVISYFADDPYFRGFKHRKQLDSIAIDAGIELGHFRFLNMSMGDAVLYALNQAHEPLTLAEIITILSNGGHRGANARNVNAALINQKGVEKVEDGSYTYAEADEPPPWVIENFDWFMATKE